MTHEIEITSQNTQNKKLVFQEIIESPDNGDTGGKIESIRVCVAPKWKTVLRYISYVSTAFIMYLVNFWTPSLHVAMSLSDSDINRAKKVVVYGADKNIEITPLIEEKTSAGTLKVFYYRLFKYYFDEETQSFKPCYFDVEKFTSNQIHEKFGQGPDKTTVRDNNVFYGKNLTDIPKKPWPQLLIMEILSPFYVFQIYSFIVWYFDEYWVYAAIILFFSAVSIGLTLYETIQTNNKLREMSYYEIPVHVYRRTMEGEEPVRYTINSSELVPGDLIEIPEGVLMPCDAIILNGSCIMNESMLTGESVPVLKNALPYNDFFYSARDDRQYTVYAGTKCIQARYYQQKAVLGLVIATGFTTVKGELIRTMMFPKPTDFRFYSDAFKFISILAIIAVGGFILDLPSWLSSSDPDNILVTTIIKTSEIITVTVPPALPTCLQIGISIALSRLKSKQIYCIAPVRINEAGRINVMCFDKTGTLTEEGLELLGVRPVFFDKNIEKLQFKKLAKDTLSLNCEVTEETRDKELQKYLSTEPASAKTSIYRQARMFPSEQMLEIMATCHSLTRVHDSMIGDPLDLKMFKSTKWVLEENTGDKYDALVLAVVKPSERELVVSELKDANELFGSNQTEIGIIRRFEFSSKLQRMSVVVKNLQEPGFKIHVKGSPEKIRELCRPESIPDNFHYILEKYTEHGYRVLACATKALGSNYRRIMAATREEVEKEFTFIGFLIMENRLKEKTTEVIDLLQSADIKTIMVTGDNALTAISVARQCNIVGQNERIFLGDVSEKKHNGREIIDWKDFDFSERVLNKNLELDVENEGNIPGSLILGSEEGVNENQGAIYKEPTSLDDIEKYGKLSDLQEAFLSHKSKQAEAVETTTAQEEDGGISFFNGRELGDYCIAVTGRAFSLILHEAEVNQDPQYQFILQRLLRRCLVFARMLPDQKASLIKHLMSDSKNVVGMCGDGANDVAALKTANVGISLSEAEASIAAPFTSNIQDISCVPILLREGKAALSTSYQEFKFMALYSIIQFTGVTVLYSHLMDFTTWQYYHVDIFIVLFLSATLAMSKTNDELTKEKPTGRLISVRILTSVIGQIVIQMLFQIGAYILLVNQSWYDPSQCSDNFDTGNACFENSTLYIISIFQYCMVAFVFMEGRPFRRPFYTNIWFTGVLGILFVLNIFVTYNPFQWQFMYDQDDWAAEVDLSIDWRNILMAIIVINSIITVFWEKVIVSCLASRWKTYRENKQRKLDQQKIIYHPPSLSQKQTMIL